MERAHQDATAPTLLRTKLYVPPSPRSLVPRPRLRARLDDARSSRLVLVSAPAGFGKTTLLAEWLAGDIGEPRRSVAWVSLDAEDDQRATFWTYVVAALRDAVPHVGAEALALLRGPGPVPDQTLLTTLLNDLAAVDHDVVLVLDDYHVIDEPVIHDGMAFLLDHLPPRLHVVLVSRSDPPLPLARFRARGQLADIRAADLRFTADEAAAYLEGATGASLTPDDVAALESRTEGWIAALQLAALSMQGRDDVHAFVAGFAGNDRYVVDYLVEEVLQRQPDDVQAFLLQTSVLSRLTGPLCDAVTGRSSGKAVLEALDRANLFLVPLDDRRRWYRYHHLFADVLRARLLDEQLDEVPALHRRASEWYDANGERSEAIRHALESGDLARAADLVELAIPATQRDRDETRLRRWLDAIPDEVIRARPVLSNAWAGSRLVVGEVDGVEQRLADAERWLAVDASGPDDGSTPVVVDESAFRNLPAAVAVHRAGLARMLGDVAGSMAHARRALELVTDEDPIARAAAGALLGLGYWTTGEIADAERWYVDGIEALARVGYLPDRVAGAITIADLQLTQGRLRDALRTYEHGLALATSTTPPMRGVLDMHVGLAALLYERDEVDAARGHLLTSKAFGDHAGFRQSRYRWFVAMSQVHRAEDDLDAATAMLDEAQRVYDVDFSPDVRPIAALRARIRVAHGALDEALAWVRDARVSADDELGYLREFEHITLARVLMAQAQEERRPDLRRQAVALLERLGQAADDGGRVANLIEVLALQAMAVRAAGDRPGALLAIERAVMLAAPEGFVRTFVDEGAEMASLLRDAADSHRAGGHLRRLLAAFPTAGARTHGQGDLVDPLSERELDVLRLLATDMSGPDISRELVVSLNTVRTHTKNIYAKLAVNNRRAAVRRAQELDLVPGQRRA